MEADVIINRPREYVELLGYEDVKTTLNVYGHLIDKTESAEIERTGML